jgi:shikimate 5-dehydrogenase
LPIQPAAFATAARPAVRRFAGASVMIPLRLAAFEICDTVDDTARRAVP